MGAVPEMQSYVPNQNPCSSPPCMQPGRCACSPGRCNPCCTSTRRPSARCPPLTKERRPQAGVAAELATTPVGAAVVLPVEVTTVRPQQYTVGSICAMFGGAEGPRMRARMKAGSRQGGCQDPRAANRVQPPLRAQRGLPFSAQLHRNCCHSWARCSARLPHPEDDAPVLDALALAIDCRAGQRQAATDVSSGGGKALAQCGGQGGTPKRLAGTPSLPTGNGHGHATSSINQQQRHQPGTGCRLCSPRRLCSPPHSLEVLDEMVVERVVFVGI